MDAKEYWEFIHEENSAQDVSWYQDTPRRSLEIINKVRPDKDARILDVGCGQAGIAGALVACGYQRVSALDISPSAIRRAQEHMGEDAKRVQWIEADALDLAAAEPFDVWHDRAVLHFFTNPINQARYVESMMRNVAPDGYAIIAVFAPDGPEKCSGLPVRRHDADSIEALLRPTFALTGASREIHKTPWQTEQAFQWTLLQKQEAAR